MIINKSTIFGSVACLAFIPAANAADLPVRKSAPIEYVRVCSEHGEGFFHVPGSDTCIQVGGRVRADTMYNQTNNRNNDSFNFGVGARINIDARTNTSYGMVRAYLRYEAVRADANYGSDFGHNGTGVGSEAGVDVAYIQFAGLTAGRAQSFFDFYANDKNFATIRSSDTTTQLLAYTATFGKGWSLTLGIEDGNERRAYDATSFGAINGIDSAGQTVPDVVGALLVEQDWGSAQLAAALHQIRPAFIPSSADGPGWSHDTDYGFAVHGGVKFKLPMLAPGDELWFEASYADGATGYLGAGNYSLAQGGVVLPVSDAFIDSTGQLKKTRGWSAAIDLLHYWTPSIRQNLFASYMRLETGNTGYETFNDGLGNYNAGFVDAQEWRVGTNLIWSPVQNFDIGVEVLYTRLDPKGRVLSDNNGQPKIISADDAWQGRLRVQREF